MKNDNLVIQIAVAMIIIALIWIIVIKASEREKSVALPVSNTQHIAVKVQQGSVDEWFENADDISKQDVPSIEVLPRLVERVNSDQRNIVKQYFASMEARDYTWACNVLSPDKCRATNPTSVSIFSREYEKMVNGYEYVNIKDLGFQSPSWKDIVCVKYSYRYKADADPRLISEIMSFYLDDVDGELKITDRVCEKKYKEWWGVRDCPIQPNARYCVGNIK